MKLFSRIGFKPIHELFISHEVNHQNSYSEKLYLMKRSTFLWQWRKFWENHKNSIIKPIDMKAPQILLLLISFNAQACNLQIAQAQVAIPWASEAPVNVELRCCAVISLLFVSNEDEEKSPRANIETLIKKLYKTLSFGRLHRIGAPVLVMVCKKGEIERNKQRRKGSSRRLVREKRAPDNKESLSFSFREKWSPKGASGEVIKSKIC